MKHKLLIFALKDVCPRAQICDEMRTSKAYNQLKLLRTVSIRDNGVAEMDVRFSKRINESVKRFNENAKKTNIEYY